MKKLLSLPPNLVECFHDIMHADHKEWFCTSDPVGKKLGSGGGTAWLLNACREEEDKDAALGDWLAREKRILLHAGGQSRRLPGYAPSGKVLTPIPVFRWARGQRITQDLLSLQLPLYEEIMERAPEGLRTLIASGDVYIRATEPLQEIPDVDVVCYGLWVDPELAKNHGVFVSSRKEPEKLDFMLQKPSVEEMGQLMQDYLFLMDIGIWLLSDRAIELMVKRSTDKDGGVKFYDMYSEFGLALGAHPRIVDEELNSLKVAILPLPGGEFHHYGTSREMISSTLAVQNCVTDQRAIMHHKVKPHPAVFVQNAEMEFPLTADNAEVWVENSHVGKNWMLHSRNIITGVPRNNWALNVPEGVCIDVVPMGEREFAARPYGFNDKFKGSLKEASTAYLGRPVTEWLAERGLTADEIRGCEDLQSAAIFPVTDSIEDLGTVLQWMTDGGQGEAGRAIWQKARKVSADEISAYANLRQLFAQREVFRKENWSLLAKKPGTERVLSGGLAGSSGSVCQRGHRPAGGTAGRDFPAEAYQRRDVPREGARAGGESGSEGTGGTGVRPDASGTDQHDGLPSAAEVVGVCGPDCVGTQPGAYRHCRGMDGYPTLQPDGGRKCGEPGH